MQSYMSFSYFMPTVKRFNCFVSSLLIVRMRSPPRHIFLFLISLVKYFTVYCTEQWVNRLVLFHIDDLFYEKVEYEKLEIIVLTQIAQTNLLFPVRIRINQPKLSTFNILTLCCTHCSANRF